MKYILNKGDRFGQLVVTNPRGKHEYRSNTNQRRWLVECLCGCGKIIYVQKHMLATGLWRSCGHDKYKNDLHEGDIIGYLTIISLHGYFSNESRWLTKCKCHCGNVSYVKKTHLRTGKTISCGCIKVDTFTLAINNIINTYKSNCQRRSITRKWELSREFATRLFVSPCHYCGRIGSNKLKINRSRTLQDEYFYYNGIDRIDNNKDYTEDNSVACCSFCNSAKSNMNVDEFLVCISRIQAYQQDCNNIEQLVGNPC